jgi:hypothetical protein
MVMALAVQPRNPIPIFLGFTARSRMAAGQDMGDDWVADLP